MKTMLKQANDLLRKGEFESALKIYGQVLEEIPEMEQFIKFNLTLAEKGIKSSSAQESVLRGYADMTTTFTHDSLVNNDDYELVRQSGLFDIDYYLGTYHDIALAGIDGIKHYLSCGWKEGRNPSREFETDYYLSKYMDIKEGNINPLIHYIKYGKNEYRSTTKKDKPLNMNDVSSLFHEVVNIPIFNIEKPINIIIPVFNAFKFLEPLLISIIKNTFMDYRIIICDDKSSDKRILPLLENFKRQNPLKEIVILENETNLGFIKTVNKLVKYTNNHFVLLNTDTEVPPYWIERLMYPIFKMKNIASTTPFTNSGTICSFPNYLEDNSIFVNMTLKDLDEYFQYVNFEKTYIEIPTGVGFCMGVNKELVDNIGMFDEIFGKGYGEENDWCQRAIKEGYKNIHVTNLFVYHKHGGSFLSEEKKELLEKNSKIIEEKHPTYMKQVLKLVESDELGVLRELIKYRILSNKYKAIVVFDHSLGGGANEYAKMKALNENVVYIVDYNPITNNYLLTFCGNKISEQKSFQVHGLDIVFYLIETLGFCKIVINNLVSYLNIFDLLERLKKLYIIRKDIDLDVLIHDYYFICPMYNLLNEKAKFCGVPTNLKICNKCLKSNQLIDIQVGYIRNEYPNLDIQLWRKNFGELLDLADNILVFSNSSKDIINKAYHSLDQDRIKMVPHTVDWVRPATSIASRNVYNFAIIGSMSLHKGINVVLDLASYINSNDIPVNLHVFGDIPENIRAKIKFDCVFEHGRYQKFDLTKLIEVNQIELIFIPSIWPETFSYTTEEAIKLNIPVAVFDLGAPAERVKEYDKGIILREFNIKKILDNFIDACNNNLKNNSSNNVDNSYKNGIFIHQIYYELSQKSLLSREFTPYYNPVSESSKIWHENDVFFKNYLSGSIRENGLYGYLSWRFEEKTHVSAVEFIDFIESNPGYDVYFINPFPELADIFYNVWSQGEFYHPGIKKLVKSLFDHVGLGVDLDAMPNNQDTLLYCNYWVGNKKFWDAYMKFTLPIYNQLNSLTEEELSKYTANSGYHTGVGFITFIMERLFSTFLLQAEDINYKPYIYDKIHLSRLIVNLRKKCGM